MTEEQSILKNYVIHGVNGSIIIIDGSSIHVKGMIFFYEIIIMLLELYKCMYYFQ